MDAVIQDIRFAGRSLRKRPAFCAAVVLTLGLGIAANTAIFSVVNAVLVNPLPFDEANRLVTPNPISYRGFGISLSIPNYYDWKEQARSWESFGAYRGVNSVFSGQDSPAVVGVNQVLGEFFDVLRVRAAQGRVFTADETEPGAAPIAVVTHAFWQNRLGGTEQVVGSSISLGGAPYTVVGVMSEDFVDPDPGAGVEVYVPLGLFEDEYWTQRSSSSGTRAVARLAAGVTLEQAQQDLDRVIARIQAEEDENAATAELITLTQLHVGDIRAPVIILMGAVGLVLLIACANVANLLLVRGEGRQREIAVRRALGAGRSRVIRQLLTESMTLAIAGGVLGTVLAGFAVQAMVSSLPDELPQLMVDRIGMDAGVLAFTLALSALTGLLFGLAPALRVVRPDIVGTLRDGGHGSSSGDRRRLRTSLVVAEIGLSLMLLAGAGLLVKSLGQLNEVDKGFTETNVLTARIPLLDTRYDTEPKWRAFFTALTERVKALPGVEYASVTQIIPLGGSSWENSISPEGIDPYDTDKRDSVLYYLADVDHFDTLDIEVVRGRKFDARDVVGAQLAVIIDETMADKYWPGQDPIGKRLTMEWMRPSPEEEPVPVFRTVVGVTRHVRHYEIETTGRIQAYLPFRQTSRWWGYSGYLLVKTTGDPRAMAPLVRGAVEAIDPDQPIMLVRALSDVVEGRLSTYSFMRGLLVIFSSLALVLAAVGIYAVMSFSVEERRREIGIRMALGAETGSVLGLVCRQGLKLTIAGLLVGAVGALAVTRSLQSVLYGVGSAEPVTLTVVAAILASVAVAAAYLPARRAAHVDPATVLRNG